MITPEAEIGELWAAGTPLLYVVTAEEDRMGLSRSQTSHGAFDIFSSSSSEAQPEEAPQQRQLARDRRDPDDREVVDRKQAREALRRHRTPADALEPRG